MWALEADRGPVNVSERHTDKAMYTGGPRKFKFFSYKVFCIELQGLQRDYTSNSVGTSVYGGFAFDVSAFEQSSCGSELATHAMLPWATKCWTSDGFKAFDV